MEIRLNFSYFCNIFVIILIIVGIFWVKHENVLSRTILHLTAWFSSYPFISHPDLYFFVLLNFSFIHSMTILLS